MRARFIALSSLLAMVALAQPMAAHAQISDCVVDEVGDIDGNRVHVKCATPIMLGATAVQFIAVSTTTDAGKRFLSLATSALLSGRMMRVDIGTGSGFPANVSGCASTNCRTPKSWFLVK